MLNSVKMRQRFTLSMSTYFRVRWYYRKSLNLDFDPLFHKCLVPIASEKWIWVQLCMYIQTLLPKKFCFMTRWKGRFYHMCGLCGRTERQIFRGGKF